MEEWLAIFLPEVILSFRDSNTKARKASATLILQLCQKMSPQEAMKILTTHILFGFAGETSLMKSTAIYVIAFMLKSGVNLGYEVAKDVHELITLLLKEQNAEIFKSYLEYIKVNPISITIFNLSKAYHKLIPPNERGV